jgi:hypothetical protein
LRSKSDAQRYRISFLILGTIIASKGSMRLMYRRHLVEPFLDASAH